MKAGCYISFFTEKIKLNLLINLVIFLLHYQKGLFRKIEDLIKILNNLNGMMILW